MGLKPYTAYYVKAYATNASGTVYGNQVEFKTQDIWRAHDMPDKAVPPHSMKGYADIIYFATNNGLYYKKDTLSAWFKESVPGSTVSAVGADNLAVFACVDDMLYKSVSTGSWVKLTNGLPARLRIHDLLVDENNVYAASDSGIYVSHNGGGTWSLNDSLKGNSIVKFGQRGGAVYAWPSIFSLGYIPQLYKSIDKGATWKPVTIEGARGLIYDFVATGNNIVASCSNPIGNFILGSDETRWTAASSDMPLYVSKLSAWGPDVISGTFRGEFSISHYIGISWKEMNMIGLYPKYVRIDELLITDKYMFICRNGRLYRLRR
jgi:hypothetical protein